MPWPRCGTKHQRRRLAFLAPEEGKAFFDQQARYVTGLSGEEFIAKWEAGEYKDQDLDATPEGRTIAFLATLIPFARQDE